MKFVFLSHSRHFTFHAHRLRNQKTYQLFLVLFSSAANQLFAVVLFHFLSFATLLINLSSQYSAALMDGKCPNRHLNIFLIYFALSSCGQQSHEIDDGSSHIIAAYFGVFKFRWLLYGGMFFQDGPISVCSCALLSSLFPLLCLRMDI